MSETTNPTKVPMAQKILLGMIGERIVAQALRKQGCVVEESLNFFDMDKDMLVDGKPCEVKTQVPFMIEDSFGVSPSQLPKIMKCHRVYFVTVPLNRYDELAGCVFEMDPQAPFKSHRRMIAGGKEVVCFPRRQDAMKQISRVTDPAILKQLRTLSTSYL